MMKKNGLKILILLLTTVCVTFVFLAVRKNLLKTTYIEDFPACPEEFMDNYYDSLFISMYDVSSFTADKFETYLARKTYIYAKAITSEEDISLIPALTRELAKKESGEHSKKVFLCIDPVKFFQLKKSKKEVQTIVIKDILEPIQSNPDIRFAITFPYYSIHHYETDNDFSSFKESYSLIIDMLSQFDNVSFDFPTDLKWIIENNYLYDVNSDIRINALEADVVFCNIFVDRNYRTDAEDILSRVTSFEEVVRKELSNPVFSTDLSDCNIVIFGDSIFNIANDNTSIQSVIRNFSNADVLDKARGGMSAAYNKNNNFEFFAENLKDLEALKNSVTSMTSENDSLFFIFEYGINDYINGVLLDNPDDKYDTHTYSGALRTATEIVQESFPGSKIIIMAPGYMVGLEEGTEILSEGGSLLSDYRDAAKQVASEYNLYLFDYEKDAEITDENKYIFHLKDGIHYNEEGRFQIGKALINYIKTIK